MPPFSPFDYAQLGQRLRELRTSRRWSLDRAAAAAALTASTLSRIETGRRAPSLEHLTALAVVYRVGIDQLLAAPPSDPRVSARPRVIDGLSFRDLTGGDGGADDARVYEITVPANRPDVRARTHPGRDWLYVISGQLRLRLGERVLVLHAGEAAEFDTRVPHGFDAVGGAARILAIFTPGGQRIHLRARLG